MSGHAWPTKVLQDWIGGETSLDIYHEEGVWLLPWLNDTGTVKDDWYGATYYIPLCTSHSLHELDDEGTVSETFVRGKLFDDEATGAVKVDENPAVTIFEVASVKDDCLFDSWVYELDDEGLVSEDMKRHWVNASVEVEASVSDEVTSTITHVYGEFTKRYTDDVDWVKDGAEEEEDPGC